MHRPAPRMSPSTATGAIGVLALQGSFNEHIAALRCAGARGVEIRKAEHLDAVDGLIIPGGESTTMAKLAHYHHLFPALRAFVKSGRPVWGTCAGLIFLADKAIGVKTGGQELVGGFDCTVHRNFFGSQLESFETELEVPELQAAEGGPGSFRGVFIRAPAILEVGPKVKVLANYVVARGCAVEGEDGGVHKVESVVVAARQGNLLGTAFHPELTADTRWHRYFLRMCAEAEERSSGPVEVDGVLRTRPPDLPIFE